MAIRSKTSEPHMPVDWELADASALQALVRGDADEYQQKRALSFVINKLAHTYDLSYHPKDGLAMAFAEGSRFVGLQIVKLINVNTSSLKRGNSGLDR